MAAAQLTACFSLLHLLALRSIKLFSSSFPSFIFKIAFHFYACFVGRQNVNQTFKSFTRQSAYL